MTSHCLYCGKNISAEVAGDGQNILSMLEKIESRRIYANGEKRSVDLFHTECQSRLDPGTPFQKKSVLEKLNDLRFIKKHQQLYAKRE